MLIKVKVKPNAGEQRVERLSDDLHSEKGIEGFYFVKLKSSPEGNKANIELIKLLSKSFDSEVKIKKGYTSRWKTVEVKE
ncbi:MAG TPA: DUF167 domain-containing protein [Candidatus Nanoarchaeia archaeon]|nr:DUF167 domain-containing protein [Candidatus Nanoarchaeia archaeon]